MIRLFGPDTMVEHRGEARNGEHVARDFARSGATECVIVAPLAVLEHVLKEGIRPLWSEMTECKTDDPQVDVRLPDGRCFRFVGFKRLTALELEYESKLEPLGSERPAVVAWLSQHAPRTESLQDLRRLYGDDVEIRQDSRPLKDGKDAIARIRSMQAVDTVLVAPLSIFDALCKQGIHPIQSKLERGRVVLRRVLGLRMEFEPVK